MPMKEYTHARGFNITSLKGIVGLYLIRDFLGNLAYIGKCEDDFKGRIISHTYGEHGKLAVLDRYINVVIVDSSKYPLHVLEHLFIWYFSPHRNEARWFFYGNNENVIKQTAKKHGLVIRGSIKKFILSFENVLIEREYDEKHLYKRYGKHEQLVEKKIDCTEMGRCLCLKCLVEKMNK